MQSREEWKPGSFTKNNGWGDIEAGLYQLYETIRVGFDCLLEDVDREVFGERIKHLKKPKLITTNFFLFNEKIEGKSRIITDELVYQALRESHGANFDKLALFALNFSYAGVWEGAKKSQRRPALWAFHYIKDRFSKSLDWNISSVTIDDIEHFLVKDSRYTGKTARKLASNLHHLYIAGGLRGFSEKKVERWWADALFLALDRLIEDRRLDGKDTSPNEYASLLSNSGFFILSGRASFEKDLAAKHLIRLYISCGGRDRFSVESTRCRVLRELPEENAFIPNSEAPYGAVHPTNPNILKSIPSSCSPLARAAGFDVITSVDLDEFSPVDYANEKTQRAASLIKERNLTPSMTPEEFQKIMRE